MRFELVQAVRCGAGYLRWSFDTGGVLVLTTRMAIPYAGLGLHIFLDFETRFVLLPHVSDMRCAHFGAPAICVLRVHTWVVERYEFNHTLPSHIVFGKAARVKPHFH